MDDDDRGAAGAALARTALIRSLLRRDAVRDADPGVPVLGAVTSHIADRAAALFAPAPRGAAMTAIVITLLLATFAATLASTLQIHHGFEVAEIAWWTANESDRSTSVV